MAEFLHEVVNKREQMTRHPLGGVEDWLQQYAEQLEGTRRSSEEFIRSVLGDTWGNASVPEPAEEGENNANL